MKITALVFAALALAQPLEGQRYTLAPGDSAVYTPCSTCPRVVVSAPAVTPPPVAGYHEPPGMATQVNTGEMRGLPAGWTMFSPATISSTGEWSGNLTAAPDAGARLTYASTVTGGYSPVRFGTAIKSPGTGWYYQRMKIRFSSNYTTNGNSGIKLCEPRTQNQTLPSGQNDNIYGGADTATDAYLAFGQQGSTTGNLPPNYSPPFTYKGWEPLGNLAGPNRGSWQLVEVVLQPETTPGAGNGVYTAYRNGVQIYTQANVKWLATGQAAGWPYLMFDPTYGGGNNSPPPAPAGPVYWDVDSVYVSTK